LPSFVSDRIDKKLRRLFPECAQITRSACATIPLREVVRVSPGGRRSQTTRTSDDVTVDAVFPSDGFEKQALWHIEGNAAAALLLRSHGELPCSRLQHRDQLRCFRTKPCLNQQSQCLVRLKKATKRKPELKWAQDSGSKSRSKRKNRKNLKHFPKCLFFKRK
jgi:hypothetical protein